MELEEYRLMFELEETHWWYRGLHNLLFSSIRGIFNEQRKISILDAGCGTGFILKHLSKYGISFGIDISDTAIAYCRERGLTRIARASISCLPFRDESFDLIISTDVFYHMAVENDNEAISEIYRVLRRGGILIVNLPAHNYLKRNHDKKVHTRHRYTRMELDYKLQSNNFKIIKISYRNIFSFLLIFLFKLLHANMTHKEDYTCLKAVWNPLNLVLYSFLRFENLLLRRINIPFGSSIFCISKR